ncbi:MAG: PLDc N-terminal domain-containing protein [Gammaproteobacteria bacterium]|nr:PLDc N-terminal domain-containing protein [Gammaproteobacteria bacterium]
MQAIDFFLVNIHTSVWLTLAGAAYIVVTLLTAMHAVLYQEREGSAIAWLGIIVLSPGFGLVLYWLFGINRIKRRIRRELAPHAPAAIRTPQVDRQGDAPGLLNHPLLITSLAIHTDHYLSGNTIEPLLNGNQTYPAMLDAIADARESIFLSSYIFDYDRIGRRFIKALSKAHRRGVTVRVLIDGIGIGYSFSWTKTDRALRAVGISTARFLPTLSRRGTRFINLRNHRKILSIDGSNAFVGGINIRDNNMVETSTDAGSRVRDLHFRVTGPVIEQLNTVFIDDWLFARGEVLPPPDLRPATPGQTLCRVLPDGPDENYLKLQTTLTAAINAAVSSINIVTPYFLPGSIVIHSLKLAVIRGVRVSVIVPERSNIRLIDWAFRAELDGLLDAGICVYFSPPPFDHSKLLLIDDYWSLIGSSNWDTRSLKLNFEVNLECFDTDLNTRLQTVLNEKQIQARDAASTRQQHRSLPARLRNRLCRLFSAYL